LDRWRSRLPGDMTLPKRNVWRSRGGAQYNGDLHLATRRATRRDFHCPHQRRCAVFAAASFWGRRGAVGGRGGGGGELGVALCTAWPKGTTRGGLGSFQLSFAPPLTIWTRFPLSGRNPLVFFIFLGRYFRNLAGNRFCRYLPVYENTCWCLQKIFFFLGRIINSV
jgi:hypothetical protein